MIYYIVSNYSKQSIILGFPSPCFNVDFEISHEKLVMETLNLEEKSFDSQICF